MEPSERRACPGRGLRQPRRPSTALRVYRTGSRVAGLLPGPVTRGLAEGLGRVAARTPAVPGPLGGMARRRRMAARHLLRVYGARLGSGDLRRRTDEAFASYGRYWAETLRLPALSQDQILAGIRYEGFEHIAAGEAAGRGTILALPHLGGWEWAGTQLALTGHPISVVMEALEPADVFEWFVGFRERLGMRVITTGPGAAAACTRALADNHLLCLLCDRVVSGAAGTEVEFFGEKTLLPAGPVTLALRTGASLLPCAVYFGSTSNQHVAVVRPPLALRREGRLRDDVQLWTQVLASELEVLIGQAPTQWHLMQPNWPGDRDGSALPAPEARRSANRTSPGGNRSDRGPSGRGHAEDGLAPSGPSPTPQGPGK